MIEAQVSEWRTYVSRGRAIDAADVAELEDHLRSQVADLMQSGLSDEEAFLIGVKRLGQLDGLSREFAREHSERLWKRLVVAAPASGAADWRREVGVALACAVGAAAAVKLPQLFGLSMQDPNADVFYVRNLGFFALPFLTLFFLWKRGVAAATRLGLAAYFIVGALVLNLLPFAPRGDTLQLAALHAPMALWLAVGVAYAGGAWRSHDQRMNYVRFTGEWFIYFVLIALGGGVLMGTTMFIFQAIGLDPEQFMQHWILPSGAAGAVVIAGMLVEAKQSVVENMAPVLTYIFTPLFTVLLLVFLVTSVVTGNGVDMKRETLIGFDLLLVLVVGLLLYAISARDAQKPAGFFDYLQCALVVCALLVNAMALWAIVARISAFGFSPNKVAALGENIILVGNLGWSAVLYFRFLGKRGGFAALERWQTAYLPVYAAWAWVVVLVFPFVFGFR
ncbi:MAG: DUF4153 domain-containing protein [Gemmatimonadota bacterium]|nr:DUF4153 domain-containing protein [Gemmatimonadota bacterium]